MTTRGFGMGFFGRGHFDKDARKKFQEEWAAMSDEQKLEIMNKRMEAMGGDEDRFTVEAIDARCEKWMKMTREEKEEFISEHKKMFHDRMHCMHGAFARG